MAFGDFMAKIRNWDNRCARWLMRHFYIMFFEFVLVLIFFIFFFSTIKTIDLSHQISNENVIEQLLAQQTTNTLIIIILLLLNSFWMLYMFSGINRLRLVLKEISYNIMRRRHTQPPADNSEPF